MARFGLLVVSAYCCFIGLIECQIPETTTKAIAAETSTKPNGITTTMPKTEEAKETTATSVETKSQGVETNVGTEENANLATVSHDGTKQGSEKTDVANPSPNDSILSEATFVDKDSSFIIPSNEIKLPGNTGTISSVKDSARTDSADTLEEESKMFGTSEIVVDESTTKGQPNASSALPSTDQTMTKSSTEGTSTSTVKISETSNKTTLKSTASTVTAVTDSTQGTVAPTVTNVVQVNPTSGTIVFKPGKPNHNPQSNDPITTIAQMIKDNTGTGKDNTTPAAGTTLNVILPSSTSTTEMTQTETSQTMTASPDEVNINSKVVLTDDVASSSKDDAKKSDSKVKITEKVAEPSAKPSDIVDKIDINMANRASEQMAETTTKTKDGVAELITSDTVTSQPVADTTKGTEQSDNPAVACSGLLCINTCPHGRQVDERGCETCECKFSPDCPTPLPTTRLLCMMQIRLGQSCSSDQDCPVQRICCPGSCGQSCRRKSSNRSRVLAILRKF